MDLAIEVVMPQQQETRSRAFVTDVYMFFVSFQKICVDGKVF
jgi:hypothetical protein